MIDFLLSVILCPEIMAPVNGTLVISTPSPTQPLGVGTTATYSCDTGYVLVGDLTRTCEDSGTGTVGTWSGSEVDPICESIADTYTGTKRGIEFTRTFLVIITTLSELQSNSFSTVFTTLRIIVSILDS